MVTDWSGLDHYLDDQAAGELSSVSLVVVSSGGVVHQHSCGDALRYSTPPAHLSADCGAPRPGGDAVPPVAALLRADQRVPATASTLFDLASNTKMWATNLALMMLVGQGLLDLERPVCDFPGWAEFGRHGVGGTGRQDVTVADLLRHEAGLIADPRYFDPHDLHRHGAGELYCSGTPAAPVSRDRIIEVICRTPSAGPAHQGYCYSDLDYMILGLLVEQTVGLRLDRYLEEGLYRRLGLRRTLFNPLEKGIDADQIAATEPQGNTRGGTVDYGPAPDGRPAPLRRHTLRGQVHDEKAWYCMAGVSGHAGLFTDAADLAVLLRLGLGEGCLDGVRHIDQAVWRHFASPQGATPQQRASSSHGLGWRVAPASGPPYPPFGGCPSPGSIGHTGWTGTFTLVDRQRDLALGLMTGARHRLGADVGRANPVEYSRIVGMVYRAQAERAVR